MFQCMSAGVIGFGRYGDADKPFTKAKFVVPIGLTSAGGTMSLHFMSQARPKSLANFSASTWVYDEEGPKTWNLEEMYMVKRIYNVLAAAGLKRADATMNFISGFLKSNFMSLIFLNIFVYVIILYLLLQYSSYRHLDSSFSYGVCKDLLICYCKHVDPDGSCISAQSDSLTIKCIS